MFIVNRDSNLLVHTFTSAVFIFLLSGVCLVDPSTSKPINAGTANADIHYTEGTVSLHYTDGDECKAGIKIKTIITFFCTEDDQEQKAVLENINEDCIYKISFHTSLVCRQKVTNNNF